MTFKEQSVKPDIWGMQQAISSYWSDNHIFEKSIEQRPVSNPYRFYDGPPFITGLPHYGHLASSVAKDTIPRFWTMKGKRVERVWGWDCHGIPIEQKVQDKLGLHSNLDIEKLGVEKFIDGCYDYTRSVSGEWKRYVDNFGRWVDFDNSYKTMDNDYMESVWWVFKELWKKGLIYKGKRVSMYSTKLETPISNFEVAMDDSYDDVNDPAITVAFRIVNSGPRKNRDSLKQSQSRVDSDKVLHDCNIETYILAWTTTPWTIPANMALGVNKDLEYVKVKSAAMQLSYVDENPPTPFVKRGDCENPLPPFGKGKLAYYIMARARVEDVLKGREYEIVDEFKGEKLLGLRYEAPFGYYSQQSTQSTIDSQQSTVDSQGNETLLKVNKMQGEEIATSGRTPRNDKIITKGKSTNHTVIHADFATEESGTGIVHQAPEFGEDDFNLAKKESVSMTEAMDSSGHYTAEIDDMEGVFYRDANELVVEKLKGKGLLFKKESITHRVAHCPRSGVPLIYKAQDSWFIDIQSVKGRLLEKAEEINRYPEHFKEGRFAKSIETAPDWCISRTRYWGTPMPVFKAVLGKQMLDSSCKTLDDESVQDYKIVGSREELFQLQKNGSRNMTKLILVRHESRDKTDIDGELDALGLEQAEALKKSLKNEKIDAIMSSSMKRCPQTVAPLAQDLGLKIHIDEGWGSVERKEKVSAFKNNMGVKGLVDCDEGSLQHFFDGDRSKNKEMIDHLVSQYAGQTVVAVSHAEVIASFLYTLRGGGSKEYISNLIDKGSFVVIYLCTGGEFDLHRPYIDDVWFEIDGVRYERISEVLDCWVESGSMPYGQMHYPFEKRKEFEASFPADYVVEYTGQIRAWFYVMHVLAVILFDRPAYKNVICHGVVYGNDGRKMSKSLGNFPDPKPTFEQYGGDAIRMSILSSPLFHAGDTAITEESIAEALRNNILPLWNAFYFFTTYANIDGWTPGANRVGNINHTPGDKNMLDQWIISELQQLIVDVERGLEAYDLQQSSRQLAVFLDNLTNRYIRRSRRRFWKSEHDGDKEQAYETLYSVLVTFCQVAAPFMPFVTEYIYRSLKVTCSGSTDVEKNNGKSQCREGDNFSVHLTDWPKVDESLLDSALHKDMSLAQQIIRIGLAWRSTQKIRVRQPLARMSIGVEMSDYFKQLVADELNVKKVVCDATINDVVMKICKPDGRKIGPKYGKDVKMIMEEAKKGNFIEHDDGSVMVNRFRLERGEFEMSYVERCMLDAEGGALEADDQIVVEDGLVLAFDHRVSWELELEGLARDVVRYIQDARKEADYRFEERILLMFKVEGQTEADMQFLETLIDKHGEYVQAETLSTLVEKITQTDIQKVVDLGGVKVVFALKRDNV